MPHQIFDIHQHLSIADMSLEQEQLYQQIEEDYRKRVKVMDQHNISQAAIMTLPWYLRPRGIEDTRMANNLVAHYRDTYHARFPVAIGTVEPLHGEKAGLEEMERMVGELGIAAVQWHHRAQGTWIYDPLTIAFVRKAGELNIPVLVHIVAESTLEDPWGLELLAEEFPKVQFIALDAFSGRNQAQRLFGVLQRLPNIIVETGLMYPYNRYADQFALRFGSERVVFGSDLNVRSVPWHHPHALYEIQMSDNLSIPDKANILWHNAQRLLGLA